MRWIWKRSRPRKKSFSAVAGEAIEQAVIAMARELSEVQVRPLRIGRPTRRTNS
jgi:hypothetical protein